MYIMCLKVSADKEKWTVCAELVLGGAAYLGVEPRSGVCPLS